MGSLLAVLWLTIQSTHADELLNSEIPAFEQGLLDELLTCIETAIESGLSTNEEVSAACSQERVALNGAVPGMGDYVIEYYLG